jgi:hypothetical protein
LYREHSEQALKIKTNEGNISKIQAALGSSGCSKQDSKYREASITWAKNNQHCSVHLESGFQNVVWANIGDLLVRTLTLFAWEIC